MGDKLSHKQHKWILTVVVVCLLLIGMYIGNRLLRIYSNYDILLVLIFGLVFLCVSLVIILLFIVVRLEEDMYWYRKKL